MVRYVDVLILILIHHTLVADMQSAEVCHFQVCLRNLFVNSRSVMSYGMRLR